jgi:hypothetical protein
MIPTPEKTNFDLIKSKKDKLIENIKNGFGSDEEKEIWGKVTDKLFPAVTDLFSSLIDLIEKNDNILREIINQQQQASTLQSLNEQ